MSGCQLLVISLNGTSWELINRLIGQGYMPVMEGFIGNGSCGPLKSVLPTLDYPCGASFHTGLSPVQHRIFGFSEIGDNGFPTGRLVSWESLKSKTLLEILSANGKRVVSLYMPLTSPPKPIDGYIVSEALLQNVVTYPPELIRELRARLGDLMIPKPGQFFPAGGFKNLPDIKNFLNKQIQSIAKTKEVALYLMGKSPVDVAFIQFYATDTVQHTLWHYLDSSHPLFIQDHDIEQMIYNFFLALDRSMDELIQHTKPSAILVFSDHGFRPCVKILNLKRFLKDSKITNLSFIKKLIRRRKIVVDFKTLYVNTVMMGKAGLQELIKKLEIAVDEETGKSLINRVWRVDIKNASVLILDLAEGYTSRPGSAQEQLLMPCMPNKDYLIGTHTERGFWVFSGWRIEKKEQSCKILDLAPTILAYLGLDHKYLPSSMPNIVL